MPRMSTSRTAAFTMGIWISAAPRPTSTSVPPLLVACFPKANVKGKFVRRSVERSYENSEADARLGAAAFDRDVRLAADLDAHF